MYDDLVQSHPVSPNAEVGHMYQGSGQPTLNVSARPQVDLLSFCCKADVYALKRSLCLHVEEAVHQNG